MDSQSENIMVVPNRNKKDRPFKFNFGTGKPTHRDLGIQNVNGNYIERVIRDVLPLPVNSKIERRDSGFDENGNESNPAIDYSDYSNPSSTDQSSWQTVIENTRTTNSSIPLVVDHPSSDNAQIEQVSKDSIESDDYGTLEAPFYDDMENDLAISTFTLVDESTISLFFKGQSDDIDQTLFLSRSDILEFSKKKEPICSMRIRLYLKQITQNKELEQHVWDIEGIGLIL